MLNTLLNNLPVLDHNYPDHVLKRVYFHIDCNSYISGCTVELCMCHGYDWVDDYYTRTNPSYTSHDESSSYIGDTTVTRYVIIILYSSSMYNSQSICKTRHTLCTGPSIAVGNMSDNRYMPDWRSRC